MKIRALIIFTVLCLLTGISRSILPVNGEVGVYDKIVRLHVIANSDSDEDQALKLKVRDAVLEMTRQFLSSDADVDTAKEILAANKDRLLSACRECISANGYDYPVEIEFSMENYPVRQYEDVTLPSGDYFSVRVNIGRAEGQNWWCVLFPPLCIGAAKNHSDTMIEAGLTKNEVDMLTDNDDGKYVLKFRIVEFFRSIFGTK